MTDSETARQVLATAQVVAVLGASSKPARPGFYVPDYLAQHGYDVLPVNPGLVGEQLFGRPVVATLRDLDRAVDIVDVFRSGEYLPAHRDEILAMTPLPGCVWFQLGVVNDPVAHDLRAHGITVVEDRCTLADHRRFGLGQRSR